MAVGGGGNGGGGWGWGVCRAVQSSQPVAGEVKIKTGVLVSKHGA